MLVVCNEVYRVVTLWKTPLVTVTPVTLDAAYSSFVPWIAKVYTLPVYVNYSWSPLKFGIHRGAMGVQTMIHTKPC